MITPSIYIDIIFVFLLCYLVGDGYCQGVFTNFITQIKMNYKIAILTLSCVTFSILFIDLPVSRYFSGQNNLKSLQPVIRIVNQFGNGKVLFALLTVLIIIFLLFKNKYKEILSISLASAIYAGLFGLMIKMLITRERPYVKLDSHDFFDYIDALKNKELFRVDYLSMPSGHTIIIFAAIIPLVLYFKNRWVKFSFAMLPILVGFARVYLFKHWLSDVIMAGFLGTMIGLATYKSNLNKLKITEVERNII